MGRGCRHHYRYCYRGTFIFLSQGFVICHEATLFFTQVLVGSLNDWQKERQFKKLNEKKEERGVKVIRDGHEKVIDIKVCC